MKGLAVALAVAASGITPLEMMLDNMRSAYQRALELEKQLNDLPPEELEASLQLMREIARQRQIAQKCAADAANYVHPKLASIQHGNDPEHPLNAVTDADRAAVVVAYIAENPNCWIRSLSSTSSNEHRPRNAPSHRRESKLWSVR
jgi:hypothetical protein